MKKQFSFYVLLLCTISVIAQEKVSYNNKSVAPLYNNDMAKFRRIPKTFEPFTINPAAGQDLPDPVILPDGTTMPRVQYLEEINKLEQDLNKRGLSIRDNKKTANLTPQQLEALKKLEKELRQKGISISGGKNGIIVNSLKNNLNKSQHLNELAAMQDGANNNTSLGELQAQIANTPAPPPPNLPVYTIDESTFGKYETKKTNTKTVPVSGLNNIIAREPMKIVDLIQPVNFEYGDRQTIGALAFAKYELTSYAEPLQNVTYNTATAQTVTDAIKKTNSNFNMYIGTKGSIFVLGREQKLFEASFNIAAPSNANKSLSKKMLIYRLGKTIFNQEDVYSGDSKDYEKIEQDIVSWKMDDIHIPIAGPISLSTSFSVTGSMGIEYKFNLNRYGLSASVKPFIRSKAVLEAAVALGRIAKVGVGGELKILTAEVTAAVASGLAWNNSSWHLKNTSKLNLYLNLLQGRLYGFAELDLWLWDGRWETDFYNYEGVTFNKYLVNRDKSVSFHNWKTVQTINVGGANQ